jgi:ribosome biogenesis GTPase
MQYTLNQLGWDNHWQNLFERIATAHRNSIPARIARVNRSEYIILSEFGEGRAFLPGSFIDSCLDPSEFPTIGDWILVDGAQDLRTPFRVQSLLPRRNAFTRQVMGRNNEGRRTSSQIIASNVDYYMLLFGLDHKISVRLVERYLTLVTSSGSQAVIVLSKSDLQSDPEEYTDMLRPIAGDAPICTVSALNNERLDRISTYIREGKTVAFLGSSGVGKTTLINAILGGEVLKMGAVRQKDLRGRHTTTWREMIVVPQGGIIIDTPGMREVKLHGDESSLEQSFSDIHEIASRCHFTNCSHHGEPGCAIEAALREGTLTTYRYDSFLMLKNETRFAQKQESARHVMQVEKAKRKKKERAQNKDRSERRTSKVIMRNFRVEEYKDDLY